MITVINLLKKRMLLPILAILFSFASLVQAKDIQVEVFYLPHRPAMAVVSEAEKVIAEFPGITLKKYSFDDPNTKELVQKYHLAGHMPVAIFINGKNSFTVDGKKMSLRNFPKGNAFVPMFAGEWNYDDLRSVLGDISGGR